MIKVNLRAGKPKDVRGGAGQLPELPGVPLMTPRHDSAGGCTLCGGRKGTGRRPEVPQMTPRRDLADSCTLSEGRTGSGQSLKVPRRTPRREIADSCTHSEGRMTAPGAEKHEIDDSCTL